MFRTNEPPTTPRPPTPQMRVRVPVFEDSDKTPAAPINVFAMQKKLEEQSQIILVLVVFGVFSMLTNLAFAAVLFGGNPDPMPETPKNGTYIKACADFADDATCTVECFPGYAKIQMPVNAPSDDMWR